MSDVSSPIRYVIVRRVGDFDEYLQDDGNFGPLTDHQVRDGYQARDMTRVFFESDHAEHVRDKLSWGHPTTSEAVRMEIWRLP